MNQPGGGWPSPPPQGPPGWGQPPPGGPPPWAQQPPAGPPNWGGPPQPPPASASQNAILALVLAVLGWTGCGCLLSTPAFFVARAELAAIERGDSPVAGKTLAQVAYYMAIANLAIHVLALGLYAVAAAIGIISALVR